MLTKTDLMAHFLRNFLELKENSFCPEKKTTESSSVYFQINRQFNCWGAEKGGDNDEVKITVFSVSDEVNCNSN
jgi:hypothetical protein